MAAFNIHLAPRLELAQPIVADANRVWDSIDTRAEYIRRSGQKNRNLNRSQTRAASCRNLGWFWSKITRQRPRDTCKKTGSVRKIACIGICYHYPVIYRGGMYGNAHNGNLIALEDYFRALHSGFCVASPLASMLFS